VQKAKERIPYVKKKEKELIFDEKYITIFPNLKKIPKLRKLSKSKKFSP
jgi:hypothetical protein